MYDRLSKIKELTDSIDVEMNNRGEPNNIIEHLTKSALIDLQKRLKVIEEILLIEKYDLVFIGQVGVGKTTAICHLLNLIMQSKKKKKTKKREKEVNVVEELMATGAGFTTLCEVVIKQDDSTFIKIDPYSREEVQTIIDDFCWTIWLKTYPDMSKDQKDQGTLPPELTRAVRNMVGLPSKDTKESDPAIKLALKYNKESYKNFVADVTERSNIAERDEIQTKPESDEKDIKQWVKETFSKLNLAKLPSFSIPRRIYIHLEPSIISIGSDRIDSIIDTKGVDAGQFNRQDLDMYIRERKNAICLLSENFLSAPSNVIDIIERHMTKEAKDISSKIALFVMPRENQPENVVGPEGPVGERDEGLYLRCNQIEDVFSGRGIDFSRENIFIYDPLECYEPIGVFHRKNQDYDQEDIDSERERVFNEINKLIKSREDLVWREVQEKEEIFLEIKEGRGLDPMEEQLIKDAKPKIEKYSHIDFVSADRFFDEYRRPWIESRHVMTLRATNNRYGEYPPRDIDICYDAKPVVEKLVRQLSSRRKDKILDVISDIKNSVSETSELQRLMPILEERVNISFEKFVRESADTMENQLSSVIFYPQDDTNQFWLDVQDRYGKGPGYREDVLSMFENQLGDYENFLRKTTEDLWEKMVVNQVLDFLG